MTNIALTGKLRSGKDSVAMWLVGRYGFRRFAFGDELKRYAHMLFVVPSDTKPRELYQWFGQMMRQREPDIWVRHMFKRVVAAGNIPTVITDLRQPNEFAECRKRGYTIIRVTCSDNIRLERANAAGDKFTLADLAHDTESHVDTFDVDYEIVNDGTLADMGKRIDEIMAAVKSHDGQPDSGTRL